MALDTGQYPAQGRLILTPTNYSTGGTDLGLVSSSHIVSTSMDTESITEHATGTALVDTRFLGMNVSYLIHMTEMSADLTDLLFNKVNDSDTVHGFTGYNVGDLLGSSQTHKLLIRPINDDGTVDTSKPTLYIPRGVVTPLTNLTWDRRMPHLAGAAMSITGLWDTSYNAPFLYGEAASLPVIA